jgi:hypothetical protein
MKSEEDKILDEFLKNSLGNYKAEPPAGMWNIIQHNIPVKGFGKYFFPKGSPGFIASISTGVVLTGLMTYYIAGKINSKPALREINASTPAQVYTENQNASDTRDSNTVELISVAPKHGGLSYTPNAGVMERRHNKSLNINKGRTDQDPDQKVDQTAVNLNNTIPASNRVTLAKFTPNATTNKEIAEPSGTAINETAPAPELASSVPAMKVNSFTRAAETKATDGISDEVIAVNQQNQQTGTQISVTKVSEFYYAIPARKSGKLAINRALEDLLTLSPKNSEFPPFSELLQHDASRHVDYARKVNNWALGLSFMPEWQLNKKDDRSGKTRYSGSLSLRWNSGPFILETGIGLMNEESSNQYKLQYNQLLGVYQSLDTITFTYDSVHHQEIPHYQYTNDSVFDPATRTSNRIVTNHYSFIQVPFLMGIKKDFHRSTFSIKGGPVLSYLYKQSVDVPFMNDPDKKLRQTIDENPARLKTNWQWMLSIGYGYHVSDRIELTLESILRGYIDSPYERLNMPQVNPLYGGFRFGAFWSF